MKNKKIETSKLRKFASFARSALIEQVGTRLKTVLAEKSLARRESPKVVEELEKKIKDLGEKRIVEMVAYTWFNRFCSLRYMDVNRYTRIGVLSPADGQFQPEILAEAKMGHIDEELVPEATRKQVMRLLDGSDKSADPQGQAYRLLLVAVCNYYHSLMPFMFEKIADYTELLLPDDLLSGTSIPAYTREALLPVNCSPEHTEESVEVIGWLYQFYIADKKDEVFDGLKKGKKITPENIPAATQLFTPHWIVRYLVENSLGRLWMLNHPDSKLIERMDYYIKPDLGTDSAKTQPPPWQPAWKEAFPMQDGRVEETMWLRPNPALIGNYDEAMHYALSVDGYACDAKTWFGGDLADTSRQWEANSFKGCSFPQLRAALFFFHRNARWNDMNPNENPHDPFWKCYRALCEAWSREWQDHVSELPKLPTRDESQVKESHHSETDYLRISSPEEIKVCDPACGSGHMLTYAFDLLYEIYREEQYPEPEIPSLILTNNLYGI